MLLDLAIALNSTPNIEMEISKSRSDLQSVEYEINRLLRYADEFLQLDLKWSHLANKEDFEVIYDLDANKKQSWEEIYCTGREFAGSMVALLQEVHSVTRHPTLTSYINRFANTWVEQTEDLQSQVEEAKKLMQNSDVRPWSVTQMIRLFETQIEMLKATKITLAGLKSSNLYKQENGIPMTDNAGYSTINIKNFQGIWGNVESSNVNQNFSQSISEGDLTSLIQFLRSIDVPSEDLDELSNILAEETPSADKTSGPRLSRWIGNMISKSASGTWKFGLGVASGVLAKAISSYYGW